MNRIKKLYSCMAVAAGLTAFMACANAATHVNVPFSGVINFQAVIFPNPVIPTPPDCPYLGGNMGSGTLTQFGKVVMGSTECIAPDPLIPFGLDATKGTLVLTASNGDIVFAAYSGKFLLSADGQTYTTSGLAFQINGGTGRFMNASGNGNLQGTQSAITGAGTLTATGFITY
jgi:hypothetical protein